MIILIDNYDSFTFNVYHYFSELGAEVKVLRNDEVSSEDIINMDPKAIVLSPGPCTPNEAGICLDLISKCKSLFPILGICLGMHMLLEFSEEHGRHAGLGLVKGSVVEIPSETAGIKKRKIPHVGWSALRDSREPHKWNNSCLGNLPEGTFCYFSHSFMALPVNADDVIATINYEGISIVSALQHENIVGIQFHPELSGPAGLQILKQFIAM